jgi:hypothetical protein
LINHLRKAHRASADLGVEFRLFQEVGDAEVDGGEAEVFVEDGFGLAAFAPPFAVEEIVAGDDPDEAFDARWSLASPYELHAAVSAGAR